MHELRWNLDLDISPAAVILARPRDQLGLGRCPIPSGLACPARTLDGFEMMVQEVGNGH
jgi:hypothetical protein